MNYKHVIVVGIDGAGAFIRDASTPCFDAIFADGAVTYSALASNPTISAECWGSMLLGVGPEVHGLTNAIVSEKPYPLDSPYPSVFKRIRRAMPDAHLGSFCDWSPITRGIVETDIGVVSASARDTELTPMIVDYIKAEKPTFLFIQMDSVDGAGHGNGYGSKAHLDRISVVDTYVQAIYDAVCDIGIIDDTLFMVIADHGGTPSEGRAGHGGWTDAEKYVTFAAVGRNVNKCGIEEMNIRDLASIVLYALGLEVPPVVPGAWTSQIPTGMFDDASIREYVDVSAETGAAPRISKTAHTSESI